MTDRPDTHITILDWKRGKIGGYLAPFGGPDDLTVAGKTSIPGYVGHYFSPDTELAPAPDGVWLNADHHWDLGKIGVVNTLIVTEQGLSCAATLFDRAAGITFEREGRTLPKLLHAGKLYFCVELVSPEFAPDGALRRALLAGVAITEHPAVKRKETPHERWHELGSLV